MAKQERIEIIGSNLNFAPVHAVTWPASKIKRAAEAAGYSGIAYLPLRSVLGLGILRGRGDGLVKAIHQPYREASALGIVCDAFRKLPDVRGAGLHVAMNLDMPRITHGTQTAASVARHLTYKVPYVAHPNGQVLGDALSDPRHRAGPRRDYHGLRDSGTFSDVQWQMTAELAANRGTLSKDPVKTTEDTVAVMREDGFGRVAWDTNHAQAERQGMRLPSPEAMVGWLAANNELGTLEYSVQPRLGGNREDLYEALNGNIAGTPHGVMLAEAASNTQPDQTLNIKVEVPAYAFETEHGSSTPSMPYQHGHELLVPILRAYAHEHLQTN